MLDTALLPPIHQLLGGHDLNWDEVNQRLAVTYQALDSFTNPKNTVEGGMICAMLDDVMGILAHLSTDKPSSTMSLSMEFLRPCFVGEVQTQAYFIKQGKSVLNMESEAWQNGKMVAKCHASFLVLSTD